MTAPTTVKGVVKPDYQFAKAVIEIWMKHWWREYKHCRRMAKIYGGLYPRHAQMAQDSLWALCMVRRACRPVRIGGGS